MTLLQSIHSLVGETEKRKNFLQLFIVNTTSYEGITQVVMLTQQWMLTRNAQKTVEVTLGRKLTSETDELK